MNESPSNKRARATDAASATPSSDYAGYLRRKRLIVLVTVVVALAIALISLAVGSSDFGIRSVFAGLFGTDAYARTVVWNLRMPRVLTAVLGGIALALAGCVMQSALRNPLASASTLGIAQGAGFGASIAIIVFAGVGSGDVVSATAAFEGVATGNPYLTVVCAFVGAMLSTLCILALSGFREMTPEAIVLAGVALSALFTGATALIQYFAEDSQVASVVFWTFGSLGRTGYEELAIMAVVTLGGAIYFHIGRWNYNALESGEVTAHSLGIDVKRQRVVGLIVASFMASTVIAFCGIINFVGLVAPHVMRRFIGSDHRYLLPASAAAGAALLLIADLLARTIAAPLVLPISAITAFVGAPVFIYLLFKGVRR